MSNYESLGQSLLLQDEHEPLSRTSTGTRRRLIWDVADSIDYAPFNNSVSLVRHARHAQRRHLWGVSGLTAVSVVMTLIAGILIAVTGVVMEVGVDGGVAWRNSLLQPLVNQNLLQGTAAFLALSVGSVALIVAAVQWIAPGAAGAGVSLVMALLNGNNIAGLLTPATYVIKLAGPCIARLAGLALGPEAPMIHLGACVASIVFGVSRRIYTSVVASKVPPIHDKGDHERECEELFSNSSHRQIVSAGVAGGLAAAFGAPIGGVLFALEEACSVWSRKTAWRCLLCTSTAVFAMNQLLLHAGRHSGGILSLSGVYPLSSRQWLNQLPFVIVVSAVSGALGALFNLMRQQIQRAGRRRHGLRLLEAAGVAGVTVVITMCASATFGRCLDIPPTWKAYDVVRFTCPRKDQYNDLATALLGKSPFVIRSFLGLGSETEPINNLCTLTTPCYFSAQALAAACAVYVVAMVLSSGLAVPGGVFMPALFVGSSFGALAGMVLAPLLPPSWDIQPGVYAMVGATATLAAVFRSHISLVVLMVESTQCLDFLPGILIAVLVSNFIAHWVHPDGIYESELERDGRVFFLRQEPPGALRWHTADTVMAAPVLGLRRIEEVSRVIEVLRSTAHNGFPVHPSSERGAGAPENPSHASRLDGFILRSQLLVLLEERAFCDAQGRYYQTPANPAAYQARLDARMHTALASSDGIVDAMEHAVDPMGPTNSASDDEMPQAMLHTMETLETLRDLPTFAEFFDGEADGRVVDAGSGQLESPASPSFSQSLAANGSTIGVERGRQTPRSPSLSDLFLNLSPFMELGMLAVRPDSPATRVHQMFVALSLRHICVTDESTRVLGIITRKDLDNAAGNGPWRTTKRAPEPLREQNQGGLPNSSSWLNFSLNSLMVPPRRVISDIMQRLSPSPRAARVLGDEGVAAAGPTEHADNREGRDIENGPFSTAFGSTPF